MGTSGRVLGRVMTRTYDSGPDVPSPTIVLTEDRVGGRR